jgi:hypothetical protein
MRENITFKERRRETNGEWQTASSAQHRPASSFLASTRGTFCAPRIIDRYSRITPFLIDTAAIRNVRKPMKTHDANPF